MWRAEKIQVKRNKKSRLDRDYNFRSSYSLLINGQLIVDRFSDPKTFSFVNHFQISVCDCGFEGCNPCDYLSIRKQGNAILIIPCFDWMDKFEEYDDRIRNYNSECPPHKWYEEGILKIEGEGLKKLLELVPGFKTLDIPEMSELEMQQMIKWETLVHTQPKGFKNAERD